MRIRERPTAAVLPSRASSTSRVEGSNGAGVSIRRAPRHIHLIAGSAWLVAATAAAAVGGFVFWLIAARIDSAAVVGRASALFTSAQFLNYATGMGLPIAIARYAHDRSVAARVLVQWSLLYTTLTSVIGAAVFFLLVPSSIAGPLVGAGYGIGFLAFALIVTGMSFALIVDMRLMTLRRWRWVFGRALVVAVVRLPFLALHPFANEAAWLLVLVAGTQAASGLVGAAALQGWSWHSLTPLPHQARRALRYASVNYVGQLAVQAPFFVLPVIVLLQVRPAANAVFYVSWSVMAVVFLSVQMISQALLAEGGKDGARLPAQVRVTLYLALGFAGLCFAASHFGASVIPSLYGHEYQHVMHLLPVLVLSTVPWAVTATYLAEARIREHAASTVAISVAFAVLVLVPAVFLTAHDAADGAVHAWLYGIAASAGVALAVSARGRAPRRGRGTAADIELEPLVWRSPFGVSVAEPEAAPARPSDPAQHPTAKEPEGENSVVA